MAAHHPSFQIDRRTRARFAAALRAFGASAQGLRAKLLFAALLGLLVTINGLNVINSYVGRDFMTAIASSDWGAFGTQTVRYLTVLALCTIAAVIFRFVEKSLGLLWREWMTRRLVALYLHRRVYHRLESTHRIANPDQRIGDDINLFTTMTLSFLLMFLNGSMSVVAFSGVLWSISPTLFIVAVTYATAGSAATIWLGRPLILLNYNQFDREAELRADLVQLRQNSEFVALAQHEPRMQERLTDRITRLIGNFRRIITVERNLNFFTTGYNYLVQILPVLIVAPLFMRGEVEFGVITQSSMAFAQLLGAFSLIVTQFQSISSYTAVVARLDAFTQAGQEANSAAGRSPIEVIDGNDGITWDHVTLEAADDGRLLLEDLVLTVTAGTRLLVTGPNEMAKVAFFRATADLWEHGRGRIIRPGHDRICFLPERPYLPPGTLREFLIAHDGTPPLSDEKIREMLRTLDLEETLSRGGGLDTERDWDDLLSLGELQRLSIARVLLAAPEFALLDRIETTLEPDRMRDVLGMLDGAGITYVTIGRGDSDLPHYDAVLELGVNGAWSMRPAKTARPVRDPSREVHQAP
jgi:putative ATP-binding cassette transporter